MAEDILLSLFMHPEKQRVIQIENSEAYFHQKEGIGGVLWKS